MEELIKIAEAAVLATDGVASLVGKKINISKDKNQALILDIFVFMKYGCRIPDAAWDIQENVKAAIDEKMPVTISKININIQGVSFSEVETDAQN